MRKSGECGGVLTYQIFIIHFSGYSREQDGQGLSDVIASAPIRLQSGRYSQRFSKCDDHTHKPHSSHPHTHTLTPHERVAVSRQDGSAWAVAMGTVTAAMGDGMELHLDK